MSKIQITLDTETKSITTALNNELISNIESITIYVQKNINGNNEYVSSEIISREELIDGTTKRTSFYSSGSASANRVMSSNAGNNDFLDTSIDGFVGVAEKESIFEDISKFYSKS
jgi:hypothetical protein